MRVLTLRSARAQTLPPLPPSPPFGPPLGMYLSRRNVAAPSPPLPACTSILASSMNFIVRIRNGRSANEKALPDRDRAFQVRGSGLSRFYADRFLVPFALYPVLNLARDPRKQGVVAPHQHVGARVHHRAALAHQDLASVHLLAAVDLHAEALGMRIATVA